MKVAARDWAFHAFSKCAHEEIAPTHRPIVPLPFWHVPQGLCDDCPGCIWYMHVDLQHWGEVEDVMSEDEITARREPLAKLIGA